jgi:preprotein translocase subunit SecE
MAKVSPFKFLQEVRAEASKVTWPTRRETAITTAMVFVMVAIASIFFMVADQVMGCAVTVFLPNLQVCGPLRGILSIFGLGG